MVLYQKITWPAKHLGNYSFQLSISAETVHLKSSRISDEQRAKYNFNRPWDRKKRSNVFPQVISENWLQKTAETPGRSFVFFSYFLLTISLLCQSAHLKRPIDTSSRERQNIQCIYWNMKPGLQLCRLLNPYYFRPRNTVTLQMSSGTPNSDLCTTLWVTSVVAFMDLTMNRGSYWVSWEWWQNCEIWCSARGLEKGQRHSNLQKGQEVGPREVQASQPLLHPGKGDGAALSRGHHQASGGKEGYQE